MGTIAADMLITHVESQTVVPVKRAYLDAQLVARASTAARSKHTASAGVQRREPVSTGARRRR